MAMTTSKSIRGVNGRMTVDEREGKGGQEVSFDANENEEVGAKGRIGDALTEHIDIEIDSTPF